MEKVKPMKVPFVDLKAQYSSIKDAIDNAISRVISDTSFIGGKYVTEFENSYAEFYGVKHCIGVGNGTDAIYIALKMLGIGQGDEVITVTNTWISTSETIVQAGAKPVFVDIEPNFYTIDVNKIEEKITLRTKAIIPVHLYGHPANMDPILDLAKKYNLKVIEDCAQAHLAEYKGTKVGLLGDIATFSFYPGKNLGAYGDAGCIITNSDELAEKCRMFANHGSKKKHQHEIHGINSRLDGIQASILSAKLPFLEKWTEARRNIANSYGELLKDFEGITLPKEANYAKHVFHLYVIRLKERDDLQSFLMENGIGTSIHYPRPLHQLTVYENLGYKPADLYVASEFGSQILSLPMYAELSSEDLEDISGKIDLFYGSSY